MKVATTVSLTLCLLSHPLLAGQDKFDPSTARAYQGYLLTFAWPEGQSTEYVTYKDLLPADISLLVQDTKDPDDILNTTENLNSNAESNPIFNNLENRLKRRVEVLSNQSWTLIFKASGDSISKNFTGGSEEFGHPELKASVNIRLGRYLETDISYQHFLFSRNSFAETLNSDDSHNAALANDRVNFSNTFNTLSAPISTGITPPNLAINNSEFIPSSVLTLSKSNRTASVKMNYLDHPTIGTLLYYEPIELEDAIERIALKTMTPETGSSLTYDNLQSTNELYSR